MDTSIKKQSFAWHDCIYSPRRDKTNRQSFFHYFFLLVAISSLFGCDSNEIIQDQTQAIQNDAMADASDFVASEESAGIYNVSFDNAEQFAKALRHGEILSIEPYVIEKDTLLYLINYEKGWTILAGDKRVNPIVAESETENISLKSGNDNLKSWIDSYADEIRVIRHYCEEGDNEFTRFWGNIAKNKAKDGPQTRGPVEYKWAVVSSSYLVLDTTNYLIPHLISTKWGQEFPWNSKLPTDINCNKRCPTGCVAVALSQIVYYMHYFLGKPTGLYHNISIGSSSITDPTSDIGFTRSNYVSNSTRWDNMPLNKYGYGYGYVGDLMLDMGNRLGMIYAGTGSDSHITASAMSYYNLAYSQSSYNYQTVRNDLFNSKPVNITANYRDNGTNEMVGHSWIIDGITEMVYRIVLTKHFEYTENWMYESEYYNTFEELRWHYHINSEYDIIEEDGGTYTIEFLLMNWGYDGREDDGFYSTYPSSVWTADDKNYNYGKTIYYNFR